MFVIKPKHVGRISFASRLFPKIKSALGLDTSKLDSIKTFDGEVFCGGRSKNKDLLTFFGCVSNPNNGTALVQLPLFRRSLKKLIKQVEQELELIGAQEILVPTLLPQKLWQQSKRLERQENSLDQVYRLKDGAETEFILGPTFEESVTNIISQIDSISETELPILLYQSSPKYRDEPNPRFGLLRTNEFFMNDLYSFDASIESATVTYQKVKKLYESLFKKLDLNCLVIQGETGNIGGKYSHEFQLPVSSGEDTIVKCRSCESAFNQELYSDRIDSNHTKSTCITCGSNDIERTQALELAHTFLLSDTYSRPLKAKFTPKDGGKRTNLEMGCFGLGLTRIIGAGVDLYSIVPSTDSSDSLLQIRWPSLIEPYKIGVVGPAKRSKQYNANSTDFIKRIIETAVESTNDLDFLVEDRDKDGIAKRIFRLQSLGIPNIVVVGERFLQNEPQVELLTLDNEKRNYNQMWLSEPQICDYLSRLNKCNVVE